MSAEENRWLVGRFSTIVSAEAEAEAQLTLTVIAEAHLGLAETNGVLSGADAIVLLQFDLVDALYRIVSQSPGAIAVTEG